MQTGLLLKKYRERAIKPEYKHGDKAEQKKEASKDETLEVRPFSQGKDLSGPSNIRNDQNSRIYLAPPTSVSFFEGHDADE